MPIEKIDTDLCIGCGSCVKSCPMDCLRFDEEKRKASIKYPRDCIACYNCEEDCPTKAIYVNPMRGTSPPPAW
jgi:NAD-dependent dihydropyrimidine dehydrogenase PreA subunit